MDDIHHHIPKYTIFKIWKILTTKDPCKKCLVRPCCTYESRCKEKRVINRLIYPESSISDAKFISIIYCSSIIILIMSLIFLIIKITTSYLDVN